MWYIGARAARSSASATSAMLEPPSTRRAAVAAWAKMPVDAAAERAVEQLDDLEHGDLRRRALEAVAALHAALRAEQPRTAQHGEQLLEELHRDIAAPSQLGDRHGPVIATAVELDERPERVRGLGGDRQHQLETDAIPIRKTGFRRAAAGG